ncbi:MAG: sensor histidine kinase [Tepidiformaceae bacterium]
MARLKDAWRSGTSETVVDWLPALALLVVDEAFDISTRSGRGGAPLVALDMLISLVMMASLGLRRRWPLRIMVLVQVGLILQAARLPTGQTGSFQGFVALCLAALCAGMYTSGRGKLLLAVVLPALVLAAYALLQGEGFAIDAIPNWLWPAVCAVLGRVLSDRLRMVGTLEIRTQLLEREREERARVAVAEERARIAREMHDIVAHNVSVMVVQAGGARRVIGSDIEPAIEALAAIEKTGRQTLQEMRRLLGVLRTEDGALSLAPQPGLDELAPLIEEVRKAGIVVELNEVGERCPLPTGPDLVAYRVIQEALTNVLKHAGQATVRITLKFSRDALELEVVDDGKGPIGDAAQSGGHGLFGMRERLSLYGGTLQAGPSKAGGFALTALLPLESNP